MEASNPAKPSIGANIANGLTSFALGNAAQIDASKYAITKEKDNTLMIALSAIGGITLAVLIIILFIILKK